MPYVEPTQDLVDRRKLVDFGRETISNTTSTQYPGTYPGESHHWDVDNFRENFSVHFHDIAEQGNEAIFSLIGLDASIANAFRRILIAEVPALAIEDVFFINNTSIIHDEVLAQRLGLIPLVGPLESMRWLQPLARVREDEGGAKTIRTDRNAVQLRLKVECKWAEDGFKKKQRDPKLSDHEVYVNSHVYASHITYEPIGQQVERFADDPIRPSSDKILIAKLRPGQKIDLVMHAVKGVGGDHAKFSPVATASYRLLPYTIITQPILGADAKKFARCFPKGIIKIERVTSEDVNANPAYEGSEGELKAVVSTKLDDMMRDPVTRECLRHDEFRGKVKLGRIQDHFVFSVESTGQYPSEELFIESVKLLKKKSQRSLDALKALEL